jgi:hypothetical protein
MTMADSSAFVPFWLDETDWVCIIVPLPPEPEYEAERAQGAEVAGYLSAYAFMTNTRMLTLLGDPAAGVYEFLFSFSSTANKKKFMELLQSNELTETEDEFIMVPSRSEIEDARPPGLVLSEDVLRHMNAVSIMVLTGSGNERPN